MTELLIASVLFLAYANGANDNFKGVATLLGSSTTGYRKALAWSTVSTFAGSVLAAFFSYRLLHIFSGKGLVPDALLDLPFLTAVGFSAACTVIIATRSGVPISTTHSLTGALSGAGLISVWTDVRFAELWGVFLLPLLVSPLLSLAATRGLYPILRGLRLRMGIGKQTCVCVEPGGDWVPVGIGEATALQSSGLALRVDDISSCAERYSGGVLGVSAQTVLDRLHFLSAGAVCLARGLNDTPKIVALLSGAYLLSPGSASFAVGLAMAAGGLLSARRVADTMNYRITEMNHGQGFTANLITSLMVLGASRMGVPVSTTHVSCGSLFGMGIATRQGRWNVIGGIVGAWIITLPLSAVLAGATILFLRVYF